jgi:dihydrofolate synthase/folylpolyglutamate synthase
MPSRQFAEKAQQHHLQGKSYDTVRNAVKDAIKDSTSKDMLFIGGSTFVVADSIPLFTAN